MFTPVGSRSMSVKLGMGHSAGRSLYDPSVCQEDAASGLTRYCLRGNDSHVEAVGKLRGPVLAWSKLLVSSSGPLTFLPRTYDSGRRLKNVSGSGS